MHGEISLDPTRLENVKHLGGGGIRAACPACRSAGSDKSGEHLLIKPDGKFGCATHPDDPEHRKEIFKLAGIRLAPNGRAKRNDSGRHFDCAYDYHDQSGKLVFQVCRYSNKDFPQRHPDPNNPGKWIWNMEGVVRVLYRLPEVMAAIKAGLPIFVCEGEKDVLAMVERGFAATCNPGGAVKKADGDKWQDNYTETLRGAGVTVIADKDQDGRKHAQIVAGKLHGIAKSVRVIELPDTNGKPVKDAADFFAAGGEAAELDAIAETAPEFEPSRIIALPSATFEPEANDFAAVTAWIRGQILESMQDDETPATTKHSAVAGHVVTALTRIGRFYFHLDLQDFDSAMFFDGNRKRLERIKSDSFAAWLSVWLIVNRANSLFKFILSEVENAALSGPHTTGILPESYWAARPGALYLSNGDGAAVKITAGAVCTVDNGADGVLFATGQTCAPWKLTQPHDVFETCAIFRNLHATAGHGPDLLRTWIYSLPTNPPNKPPLCLAGEIQSGKTRLAELIAEFYGVPVVTKKVVEERESDFWTGIDAGGIYTLDNADTKCRWLPDAVASAATGGCDDRRKLYTDRDRVILRARAWLCITTSNATFAADSGLADRLLPLRMARGTEATSDAALTVEIRSSRDAGLSHIAHILSKALADTGPTPAKLNERHPDFAAFAVKIGRALGRETEAVAALKTAESDKSAFCLENDTKGTALLAYLREARKFTGTAAELAPKLIETDKDLDGHCSAKSLGKRLSALWPHLQKALTVCHKETNRNGVAVFTFKTDGAGFAGFQTDFSQNP